MTMTCTYCGKRVRTLAERNCASPESPDGRHKPVAERVPADAPLERRPRVSNSERTGVRRVTAHHRAVEHHRVCVHPWTTGSHHYCRLPAGHDGPVHECTCGAVNEMREL